MSYWTNSIKFEPLSDGRSMRILEDACYIDLNGIEWWIRENDITDGASIPRFLWVLIGSPFVGKYRKASVIHDVHCRSKTRSSSKVHKVFHEIMIDDKVQRNKAYFMWLAVKIFGPKFRGEKRRKMPTVS